MLGSIVGFGADAYWCYETYSNIIVESDLIRYTATLQFQVRFYIDTKMRVSKDVRPYSLPFRQGSKGNFGIKKSLSLRTIIHQIQPGIVKILRNNMLCY